MRSVLIYFFLLLSAGNTFSQTLNATAAPAIVDMSGFDLSTGKTLSLNSEWELYWNKLLSPADFKSNTLLRPDALVKPVSFNDLKITGKTAGGEGHATYRILLKDLPKVNLMLAAYSTQTSLRVFINDSLVLEVGKPGADKTGTEPMNRDAIINIPSHLSEAQIIVQIANFHHRKGGFVHPFEIGPSQAIIKQYTRNYLLDVIESSALFILGLFLFALFFFRRKDLSVLYFALFCITLSFRPIIAVNYFLSDVFNGINWDFLLKMEYLGVLFPCLFMLLFIKQLFPKQLPSLIVKIIFSIMILKILITLIFPPSVFSWLIPPLLIIIPIGVIVFAITIIRAISANEEASKMAGLGLLTLLLSLILKVMVYAGILPPLYVLITVMDIAFIFMMSMILGFRFSLQFSRVERLQKKTEMQREEIEQKKAAIEEKNKNIIDSINYAKRIQLSLLPREKYIAKILDKFRK